MAETEHDDFIANKEHAQDMCKQFNHLAPNGMTIYSTDKAFGASYKAPEEAPGANFGNQIKYNQAHKMFIQECRDLCDAMKRLARSTNLRYGRPMEKSKRVIECEKTMIDGKCQCGYSASGLNLTKAPLSMVGSYAHRGVYVKDEPKEDEEVLW